MFRAACFVVLLVLLSVPALSQTSPERWIDYAAGDYDIFPNITYAKANNIELKLDLYLPKNRTNPTATLVLFHGGGWVDGQKDAREWFGSMSNAEQLAKQVSPVNYVRAGLPPIITIHGENDDVAPYNHSVRLHSALDKAGVPNQLVTIRGRKHGGFNRDEMASSYAAIREFLRKQGL